LRYVIDASVAVRWFLENEQHPNADAVLHRLVRQPELFAVPELFAFEVFAVLQRLHPNKNVYEEGVLPLLSGGMLRYPMTEELAVLSDKYCQAGLTGYDATYAALAEMLESQWLTFDARAHALIQSRGISISLFDNVPELLS
jgi:predicted nucleic acid-binding protein